MRVIAGSLRGKLLRSPPGQTTRPVTDRVKQQIFDRLVSLRRFPPHAQPAVLDLFSGTGSFGIEALSRGSAWCTFVEHDAQAAALLRQNLQDFALLDESSVLRTSLLSEPGQPATGLPAMPTGPASAFDLIFVDPPYRFSLDCRPVSPVGRLIDALAPQTAATALLTLRTQLGSVVPESLSQWERTHHWANGTMQVSFFARRGPADGV